MGRVSSGSEDPVPRREPDAEYPARPDGTLEADHHLRLSGELSRATVARFEKAIRAALQASPRELVIDLTEVAVIDDAGLTSLLKAHLRSRRQGVALSFVPEGHPAVRQVVAVTGNNESSA